MKLTTLLIRGSLVTIVAHGVTQVLRFITNVVLARLLAPELFGIMVIVNTVRIGIAFSSDVGVTQSVVVNRGADDPDFYNTAWTINLIRGFLLWLICVTVAAPLADFYKIPELTIIFPLSGLMFVISALASLAPVLLQKRTQFLRLNLFEVVTDSIGLIALMVWAYFSPSIWALVLGGFFTPTARLVGSYFLLPDLRHRMKLTRRYAWQILSFSKWIFVSSIAVFFAMNFDRLFLGKVLPMGLLGVYGIGRALSEPLTLLVSRLGNSIIFPAIAAAVHTHPNQVRSQIAPVRSVFVLTAAAGLSVLIAISDLLIVALYDPRYHAATWMAPILIAGGWACILCNLNESILLGYSKPKYGARANLLKVVWLVFGLPFGFNQYGAIGAILIIASSDIFRYVPILLGQIKEGVAFLRQDIAATLLMCSLVGLWMVMRHTLGLSLPFDAIYAAN